MYFFTKGPSEKDNKKIKVVIFDEKKKKKKTLNIGQMGYQDYPQHQDEERKQRYIERHKKNEDWEDIMSKGFLESMVIMEQERNKRIY